MDFSALSNLKAGSPQERKEIIKQQVVSELAQANAQELLTKATHNCYAKCVPSPSSSLSSKEEKCLGSCMERYFEAFNVISAAYVKRVSDHRGSVPASEMGL